jgi:hypothetical protein
VHSCKPRLSQALAEPRLEPNKLVGAGRLEQQPERPTPSGPHFATELLKRGPRKSSGRPLGQQRESPLERPHRDTFRSFLRREKFHLDAVPELDAFSRCGSDALTQPQTDNPEHGTGTLRGNATGAGTPA